MKVTTIGNCLIDESTYVNGMRARIPNHCFLIDTGRNDWNVQATGVHRGAVRCSAAK